ncbi:helix-turn-helix domain-containing protein [Streptomyces sp. Da 82-17]|uniref:helix-turn-helix domain-containing protein n=1 Tax=Streptomyces sp. Da 82-17 TaxID=3377116 RepID=UPI0038D37417
MIDAGHTHRYRLIDPLLLRRLMARTGTGSGISVRQLAAATGVSHGTIDNLIQGRIKTARHDVAHKIAETIGVDLLILWAPTGRVTSHGKQSESAPRLKVAS